MPESYPSYDRLVQVRQLEYLVALAREQHFGRAADVCHVTQSTLSEAISRLEQELGVTLVERGHHFNGLTAEGIRVLASARAILAAHEALDSDLALLRGNLVGRLRIGVVPSAIAMVPVLLERFSRENPLVDIDVRTDLTARGIQSQLTDYELDAGISYLDDLPPQFHARELYREEFFVVTDSSTVDGQWATTGFPWEQLAELPLVLLSRRNRARRFLDAALATESVVVQPAVETSSVALLFLYLARGRWSSIVSRSAIEGFRLPPGKVAVPLHLPGTLSVGLVTSTKRPGSLIVQHLEATLDE